MEGYGGEPGAGSHQLLNANLLSVEILLRIVAGIVIMAGFLVLRETARELYRRVFTARNFFPDAIAPDERTRVLILAIPLLVAVTVFQSIFLGTLMAAVPFYLTESIVSRAFIALAVAGFGFAILFGFQFLLLFLPYSENDRSEPARITWRGILTTTLGCFVTLTALRWIFI